MALCSAHSRMVAAMTAAAIGGSVGAAARAQCTGDWIFINRLDPPARLGHSWVYDGSQGRTILFGGYDSIHFAALGDTWAYTGTGWTLLSPATSPPARYSHGMTYDSGRQRVVVFGGLTSSEQNDTWEWNGTTWARVHDGSGTAPSRRAGARLAYDASRSVSVLFGGRDVTATLLGDTWEFNGATATWTQATPAAAPAARDQHAMAYDAARQRVVVFGGQTAVAGVVNDTWEWNGTSWTPFGGDAPEARVGASMSYDSGRQRLVLFGGSAAAYFDNTWERSGTSWSMVATTQAPSGRQLPAMTYDAGRARTLLYAGEGPNGGLPDPWEYFCGSACYPNCDSSTMPPILNVGDFVCFQQRFAASDPYANCDGSTIPPVLNVADFVCFQQRFAAGCP